MPRIHRLPQRLDYTLIPAPLDLSLPLATEKSPLPAIIVTPSSPSHTQDFSIAFLAPPTKPSIWTRISTHLTSLQFPARTTIFLLLLLFVLLCHLITHRLAAHRPHFDFGSTESGSHSQFYFMDLFDLSAIWDASTSEEKRSFIISEM